MKDGHFTRLQELVAEALEHDPSERAVFLRAACGDEPELLAEAESLLGFEQAGEAFLEKPALALLAEGGQTGQFSSGDLPPGTMLDDYRILELLGEGGMGEVYLAEDTKLERRVALKLLKRRLGDEALGRRFAHERKVLAALTHPNIARLYGGATTPEGRSYLVMEYVEGEPLDRYCTASRLKLDERLALFRKVCAAVGYAHQNLVVHRDLKPANIRVTPEGEPKLLDFGIAKLLDPENTRDGIDPTVTLFAAMTPEYASPEQVRGEPTTTASDVYSLGVVLYELLTGQRPHRSKGRRADELARAICEEEAPRPSTVVAATPATGNGDLTVGGETPARWQRLLRGDLDNIVAKALAKEPARRYASVAQLSEDIRRHGEGLPVGARRDTLRYRAGKFVRRNKVLVAAALLVTLALLTGLVAATWQARVARQERDRARLAQASAETALRQAERINGFLQHLLGSANPDSMGRDVKVVTVLGAAAKTLDQELADQPEILGQAHLTIARAYANLREAAPAEAHARQALAIFHRLHGDAHPATAEVKAFLGRAMKVFRRYGEAEPLLRDALAVQRQHPPVDPDQLSGTLFDLGNVLSSTGRAAEGQPFVEEAMVRTRRDHPGDSVELAQGLNILGNLRLNLRDPAGAEAAWQQAVKIYHVLSPPRFAASDTLFDLFQLAFNQGRLAEAETYMNEAAENCRKTVGEENPSYGVAAGKLAVFDFLRGDYHAAIPRLRHCLQTVGQVYPKEQADMVLARATLGLCLTRDQQAVDGEPLLREAVSSGQRVSRKALALVGNLEAALGECLLAQNRHAEAEGLLLAGYEELKTRLGAGHQQSAHVRQLLRGLYTAWNKPEQAARFAEE